MAVACPQPRSEMPLYSDCGRGCWDNAAIESFFSSFNAELVYLTRYEAKTDLLNYIRLYSHPRRHSTLGYLSPIEV